MADVYKRKIIKLLEHEDYTPLSFEELADALGVSEEDFPYFKTAFTELRQAGHVVIGSADLVSLPALSGKIIGKFRANPRGFGFVSPLEPNSHGDLFIPPGKTRDAMNGDTVVAKVSRKGSDSRAMRFSGKIIEILERANSKFVGTLTREEGLWVVYPDGGKNIDPIAVSDVTAKGAKAGDKVIVEVISFPTKKFVAEGVILEVFGKAGRYDAEIQSTIRQFNLPGDFPQDCLTQAHEAAAGFSAEAAADREEITTKTIITIDPPDARDFDDAISLEQDKDGNPILGVHIADVSSFIAEGSPLDLEARERGNSVYLPDKVIPMLPEVLSNGVCSLQPDKKRFVKSVYITYDDQAKVIDTRFANSIIQSAQRLTYVQADQALQGKTDGLKPEVVKLLKKMESLAGQIEYRRREAGMLHLDLPEIELVHDDNGQVIDAHPAEAGYPHTIIEMFMVEANEAAARLLDGLQLPFMRRIHPDPDALAMQQLAKMIKALGLSLPKQPDRHSIQALLKKVQGRDSSLAVNLVVLRSFEKAQYSPLPIGHYALASKYYCHFTSPIRRYADLLVHRLLDAHLTGTLKADEIPTLEDLQEIGYHISFTEQRAEDAERDLKNVLILELMSERIGQQLDCVITGITSFGIFAQSKTFGIEGLIQKSDLGPDNWKYNPKKQCIIGANSGQLVKLGQPLTTTIVSVDIPARHLNMVPSEPLGQAKTKPRSGKKNKKQKGRKNRKSKK